MNPKISLSLVGAAVVLSVAYGGYHFLHSNRVQSTDDARITADSVLIAPQVAGVVSRVAVADNERVKAGQLLVEIDARDFQAAQVAAIATVNAAEAELRHLAAQIDRQTSVIAQADATIHSTAASLRFAEANAQRYRNLSKAGAGTQEEQQKAEADLSRWQAVRDHDNAAKVAQQKDQDVLKAQVDMARATVQKARAALVQADLNVSYTRIVAPQDGLIGQRSVRVGAYVSPGKAVMAVVPISEAFVVANFRETQLAHMRPQQAVELHVDSYPDRVYRGHIDSLAPATGLSFSAIAPDNATGNFTKVVQRIPVKVVFAADQPDLADLRVGMSVVVDVDTLEGQ